MIIPLKQFQAAQNFRADWKMWSPKSMIENWWLIFSNNALKNVGTNWIFFQSFDELPFLIEWLKIFELMPIFFPSKVKNLIVDNGNWSGWSNFFDHWLWLSKVSNWKFLVPNLVAIEFIFDPKSCGDQICF